MLGGTTCERADWAFVNVGLEAQGSRKCAIKASGALWCWTADAPVQMGADTDWTLVSSSPFATRGIRQGAGVFCWGQDLGAAAVGSYVFSNTPVALTDGADLVDVSLATLFLCGRRSDGTAACWGNGTFGALGTGDAWYTTPAPVQD